MICGFYALFQIYQMLGELKAFRGKDDINPIVTTLLWVFMCWGLPAKVLEAKQMAGVPNPQVAGSFMYFLLGPYFMANDLNEIWQAAGGGQPR